MADGGVQAGAILPHTGNARVLRDALGRFATEVAVVTIGGPDGPMGFTAKSFCSLSIDLPLVLWSPSKTSQRFPFFAATKYCAAHVLGHYPSAWPARFARGGDGLQGLDRQANSEGVPVLPETLARFDCADQAAHDGGDHLIDVGRVLRFALEEGEPRVFSKGRNGGFSV